MFEIDPFLKREFHSRLVRDGRSAKDWLIERIDEYLTTQQATLPFAAEDHPAYAKRS